MIDVRQATDSCARLGALKFFPSAPIVQAEIVKQVCEMASTNEQIDWLVSRALKIWGQWEGIRELRAVLCNKFKPADGYEVYSQLPQFADGIPSEKADLPALAAAPQRQLTAGDTITAAPSIEATVRDLAMAKDMNRSIAGYKPTKVRDIPVVKITDANRITAADIARAQRELHEKQAKQEVGIA